MKRLGFSRPAARPICAARARRRSARCAHRLGVRPAYKMVDTCAGEFPSSTPTSTRRTTRRTRRRGVGDRTVVILGSGPNRIGQGVEFDYCCVRAALAFRELGFETMMVNSNPGDRLHRLRHLGRALLRAAHARGRAGDRATSSSRSASMVQLGGQTPLRLARALESGGRADPRHVARRDRPARRTAAGSRRSPASSAWPQPPSGIAYSVDEAVARGGPDRLSRCWCGPSYVLGGRAMEIVYDDGVAPELLRRARRGSRRSTRC